MSSFTHFLVINAYVYPLKSNVFKMNKLAYNLFILLSLNEELI